MRDVLRQADGDAQGSCFCAMMEMLFDKTDLEELPYEWWECSVCHSTQVFSVVAPWRLTPDYVCYDCCQDAMKKTFSGNNANREQ